MDVFTHQICNGLVDQPVAGEWREPPETLRGDPDAKMTAFAGAGVTGMLRAVIV